MADTPQVPFVPFAPNFQPPGSPPLQPEQESNKPPRKRASSKKGARQKPPKPTAPPETAPIAAAPVAPKRRVGKHPALAAPYGKANKRVPKYDLQTILKIAATLKEGDSKVFEKMLGELSALAKGSRERVLKALGEVFG